MASEVRSSGDWRRSPVRFLMWGSAAFLLALPAVAMQFTREVDWGAEDFLIMGVMLALACGTVELGARASSSLAYRVAVGIAVLASFLLIWMNLAVGIIGSEDNPANLMFAGVIAIGIVGAVIARGQPAGMARAMAAAGAGQLAVAVVALAGGLGAGEAVWPVGFVFLSLAYVLMWLSSAGLFRSAARAA